MCKSIPIMYFVLPNTSFLPVIRYSCVISQENYIAGKVLCVCAKN